MPSLRTLAVGLAAVLIAGTACSSPSKPTTATSAPPTSVTPTSRPATSPTPKVAVIVMENHEAGAVEGSSKAPFLNDLAHRGARAANWYGIRHPSLPNYLAMIGGSTFGITDDCTDCHRAATTLVDQLEEKGIGWRGYMEGMPQPCFTGAHSGRYAKKHNPFVYFDGITSDQHRCANVVPFDRLAADERGGTLPGFSFITPDLCNDTHDCGIGVGDRFLAHAVPPLLDALGPDGLLVITYDEGDTDQGCCREAKGGRVMTVFAGGRARTGAVVDTALDHYSLLRTVEDLFGLAHLGQADCTCTASAASLLR